MHTSVFMYAGNFSKKISILRDGRALYTKHFFYVTLGLQSIYLIKTTGCFLKSDLRFKTLTIMKLFERNFKRFYLALYQKQWHHKNRWKYTVIWSVTPYVMIDALWNRNHLVKSFNVDCDHIDHFLRIHYTSQRAKKVFSKLLKCFP